MAWAISWRPMCCLRSKTRRRTGALRPSSITKCFSCTSQTSSLRLISLLARISLKTSCFSVLASPLLIFAFRVTTVRCLLTGRLGLVRRILFRARKVNRVLAILKMIREVFCRDSLSTFSKKSGKYTLNTIS